MGCATLPDTDAIIARHVEQAVRFESARGALSVRKNAEIIAELKRRSGDIDILDKQIALEKAIGGSPLYTGNRIGLLRDGRATYRAMFAAIRNARDHINLEFYIIEDDDTGKEFADLLLAQQQRGIQVNLIYDSVGGIGTPKAFFERLVRGGIRVLEFNPVNPFLARAGWNINNRDHRKLLIVDGVIAFIGGINISSVYGLGSAIRRNGPKPPVTGAVAWRDTDIQLQGPVVGELQRLFLGTWAKQGGAELAARNYFPQLVPEGSDIVRAVGSTPDDAYSLIYLTLISAIGNAERRVWLTQAYFVPDPRLVEALVGAAARGVDVQMILPGHSDSASATHAGRSHYSVLLEAGVKIHQRRGALLHSKTAVIDSVWSCVGSSNMDWRSFLDNDEINAVVLGRGFAGQMEAMFADDLAASEAIDLASWERRPWLLRLKEWLTWFVQRLL